MTPRVPWHMSVPHVVVLNVICRGDRQQVRIEMRRQDTRHMRAAQGICRVWHAPESMRRRVANIERIDVVTRRGEQGMRLAWRKHPPPVLGHRFDRCQLC